MAARAARKLILDVEDAAGILFMLGRKNVLPAVMAVQLLYESITGIKKHIKINSRTN